MYKRYIDAYACNQTRKTLGLVLTLSSSGGSLFLLLVLNLSLVEALDEVGDLIIIIVAGSTLGRLVGLSKLAKAGERVRAKLVQDTGN